MGYRGQRLQSEGTLVILDKAFCTPNLEEQLIPDSALVHGFVCY